MTAKFLEDYADFLRCHVESWTVTSSGTIHPEIRRHFIRIQPLDVSDVAPDEDLDNKILSLKNRPPGKTVAFPARDIVDAGFLELVRYGILPPGDPLIEDSLTVVDRVLGVETDSGPCWRRYNHDGYGQREDGGPYEGWGQGRAWPLLTGERGHYELSAGRDVAPYVKAMEGFASGMGMLPEQIWDEADRPELKMLRGCPTGSAMPLMWAHAEYIKLLRSRIDGRVFDLVPEVEARYGGSEKCRPMEIWKFNRMPRFVPKGWPLRLQASAPFRARWTQGDWIEATDIVSTPTTLGIYFADIEPAPNRSTPIRFTFFWTEASKWEGRDFVVPIAADQ